MRSFSFINERARLVRAKRGAMRSHHNRQMAPGACPDCVHPWETHWPDRGCLASKRDPKTGEFSTCHCMTAAPALKAG